MDLSQTDDRPQELKPPFSDSSNQGQRGNAASNENDNGSMTNRTLEAVVPKPIAVKLDVEDNIEMSELHPVLSNYGSVRGEMSNESLLGYETEQSQRSISRDDMPNLMPQNQEKDIETILTEGCEEEGSWLKKMHPNEMLLVFTRCDANDATYRKLIGEPPFSDSSNQGQQGNASINGNDNGSMTNRTLEPVVAKPSAVKQEMEDEDSMTVPQQIVSKEEPNAGHAYDHPNQLLVDVKMEVQDAEETSELHPVLSDHGSVRGEMSDESLLGYESEQRQRSSSRDDMSILMPQNQEKDIETILTEASEEEGAWLKTMHPNEKLLIFTRCDANDATYRKLIGEPPFSDSSNQGQQGNAAINGNDNGSMANRTLEPVVPQPFVVKVETEDVYKFPVKEEAEVEKETPKKIPKTIAEALSLI
ncbi:hypothetical protein CAEBREN_19075 [Caenorhabditis brenneri]|uniref:Uncharacterized protein n=1 Tax=Caenorhabditis brenneri TaxID=135651 RepID=G0MH85_CAEBE|nr:hypothetical protein CAEBREN_19075 [Caenorhabditis brenneri]